MIFFLAFILLSQQSATDLNTVISRAADYVAKYEADLGNLIGTEEYLQTSVWLDNGIHLEFQEGCNVAVCLTFDYSSRHGMGRAAKSESD
jgi:hypothetical protein